MPARKAVAAAALLALGACQEPFGASRRDLRGFRVAAITAAPEGDGVRLGVAVVVDGRPWSDGPVALRWYAAPDPSPAAVSAIAWEDPPLAEGPTPLLDPPAGPIALLARHDGAEFRAVLTVASPPSAPVTLGPIEARALPLTLGTVQAPALQLQARRALDAGEPVDAVAPGAFARLAAATDPPDTLVRWMHTAPGGTFFDLDASTTDWVAGALRVDDDEVDEATPGPAGARTVLALALPDALDTANAWAARELWVGDVPDGVWTPGGRFLPSDGPLDLPADTAWVAGTLVADDDAPSGVALQQVAAAGPDDDPGTADLPCGAPVSGPFDPDWLLAQRCARADVLGARVVVEVR